MTNSTPLPDKIENGGVRRYKTTMKVIDEFYNYCTQEMKTPTLIRFISYINYHVHSVQ